MEREINTTFKDSKGAVMVKRSNKSTCIDCCYNEGALSFCWDKAILAKRGECRMEHRMDYNHVYFQRIEKRKINYVRLITYTSIVVLSIAFWCLVYKLLF